MPYWDVEEHEERTGEKLTESQQEALKQISDKLAQADAVIKEAEEIARKNNLPFNSGVRGVVGPDFFHDEEWSTSSIGC